MNDKNKFAKVMFDLFTEKRTEKIEAFEKFCNNFGHQPSVVSLDKNESVLARWFSAIEFASKSRAVNKEEYNKIFGWASEIRTKFPTTSKFERERDVLLIEEFCKKHKFRPSRSSTNEYETELGNRFYNITKLNQNYYRESKELNKIQEWSKNLVNNHPSSLCFLRKRKMAEIEKFCKEKCYQPSITLGDEKEGELATSFNNFQKAENEKYKDIEDYENIKTWVEDINSNYPKRQFYDSFQHNSISAPKKQSERYFRKYAMLLQLPSYKIKNMSMNDLWQAVYENRKENSKNKNQIEKI